MMEYTDGVKAWLHKDECFKVNIYSQKTIDLPFIHLTTEGTLVVKKGFAWDGPSVPLPTWILKLSRYWKFALRASAMHDAGYRLLRLKLITPECKAVLDEHYEEECIKSGMWEWVAKLSHRELRKFGTAAAKPKNIKLVKVAP